MRDQLVHFIELSELTVQVSGGLGNAKYSRFLIADCEHDKIHTHVAFFDRPQLPALRLGH